MVSSHHQRGVTYIALLLAVAITSGVAAAGASVWSQMQRREREKQLLWAGDQIRRAILAYSQTGGDGQNRYPATLQDLLLDPRSAAPRRYLRQVYEDPMSRSNDWGMIRNPQGRIVGVYSQARGVPIKAGAFARAYTHFERAPDYAAWTFTVLPPGAAAGLALPAYPPGVASPERAASAPPPLTGSTETAVPAPGQAPAQPLRPVAPEPGAAQPPPEREPEPEPEREPEPEPSAEPTD
jgi:type II secretory pathway pseudopilin PulG